MWFFKRAEEDILDLAHRTASSALGLFHEAVDSLHRANEHLSVVEQNALSTIANEQDRLTAARDKKAKNESVIAKIQDLVG